MDATRQMGSSESVAALRAIHALGFLRIVSVLKKKKGPVLAMSAAWDKWQGTCSPNHLMVGPPM